MIFMDCSVPRGVAKAVKKGEEDVRWLGEIFPVDTPDTHWLREAGNNGWLVITRDRKIRTRPGERGAIMEYGVGCFILTYKQPLTKEEITQMILENIEEMKRRFRQTPRPFIYTVSRRGQFREYARRTSR